MANVREIQSRIKSIQNTMKITNAMYMVSSTKLRRARNNLEKTEPYFFTLQSMIARIIRSLPDVEHVFFQEHTEKAPEDRVKGLLVVTADKGLAGAYNHNVLKEAHYLYDNCKNCKLFVVGRIGRQYFRGKEVPIVRRFHYSAQNPSLHRARVLSELLMEQFKRGELDEVHIVYTSMKNSMTSELEYMQLLPFSKEVFEKEVSKKEAKMKKIMKQSLDEKTSEASELVFNPSPNAVLDNILPDCVMGYIYGALVESFCSEQNARMMAMDAANKSAVAMIHDLSIELNRVRQAMITQEITEVIAGAKAQRKKKRQK